MQDDLNAPDLYIPLMAFVTYVLLAAFVLGTRDEYVYDSSPPPTSRYGVY
jgi:hypothetical protein